MVLGEVDGREWKVGGLDGLPRRHRERHGELFVIEQRALGRRHGDDERELRAVLALPVVEHRIGLADPARLHVGAENDVPKRGGAISIGEEPVGVDALLGCLGCAVDCADAGTASPVINEATVIPSDTKNLLVLIME